MLVGVARDGPPTLLLLQFLLENHVVVLARCALDDRNLSHMASGARLLWALVAASYAALPLEGEAGGEEEASARAQLLRFGSPEAARPAGWRGGWLRMLEEEVEEEWADTMGLRGNDMIFFESPAQVGASPLVLAFPRCPARGLRAVTPRAELRAAPPRVDATTGAGRRGRRWRASRRGKSTGAKKPRKGSS
jgi:hypothetical protein